jgi:hypothetical protein
MKFTIKSKKTACDAKCSDVETTFGPTKGT